MVDDVVLNKAASLERCLERVREEYAGGTVDLASDVRRQDALVLNLLRACETAIDLAMHQVRIEGLGVPQSSRHAFALLEEAGIIEAALSQDLQRMVGSRNIAVHRYEDLDTTIIGSIVTERLGGFRELVTAPLRREAP